ncbi:hypothetical protein INT45_000799 [Circinella minor]|uniref:Uncharacterized protein n=1 Tax=Circinella minor TaxID=1195481 RepID=A0A8H7RSD4_9FUNG|nr:hypothetical protein INT45_000799 [Circinella minor]
MTAQLKQEGMKDGRFRYNADGIIKDNNKSVKILLIDVSCFGSDETGKVSFDCVQNNLVLALPDEMWSPILGQGTAVRHWTMSVQAPNIFVMNKGQRVEVIPVNVSSKDLHLTKYIEFYKSLASACEDTMKTLAQLKDEHKDALHSATCGNRAILNSVKPLMVRLNEGKHMTIVADEEPKSTLCKS